MNIHEYQAKELLAKFGVPVPAGHAAMSVEEAVAAAEQLPGPLWVVKAQIHAGGRGKGKFKELGPDAKGGVRLAQLDRRSPRRMPRKCSARPWSRSRPAPRASRSSASTSPTASTSPRNSTSRCWSTARPAASPIVASTEGGMDIEAVAHDTPEKIETITIDPGDRADAAPRPRRRGGARA